MVRDARGADSRQRHWTAPLSAADHPFIRKLDGLSRAGSSIGSSNTFLARTVHLLRLGGPQPGKLQLCA